MVKKGGATPSANALTFSDATARRLFDSLSVHIAIIDREGYILETNRAWQVFSEKNGMPGNVDFRRQNYLAICDSAGQIDSPEGMDASAVAAGIRQVISGDRDEFLYDYPCHSPEGKRWYYMRVVRMDEDPLCLAISHEDITALKQTEEALRQSHEALQEKHQAMEEMNIALKVLLEKRDQDRREMEETFLKNLRQFVLPYVNKLKGSPLSAKDKVILGVIEDHLNDIVSPLMKSFSNAGIILTPQEMQVASLIKDGHTTKEIAEIMVISEATVSFHRKNLRTKLGLRSRKTNLRAFLMSRT